MKFAYLVMTELRSLNKNIQNLYKYIINPFEADIFICVQETSIEDYEKIKLFDKNVIDSKIYKKPDPFTYFGDNNYIFKKTNCNVNDLWSRPSNLQIFINYNQMVTMIKDVAKNYDYFITMRTDVEILFPFPDKNLFNTIPQSLYSFDVNYNKDWGGSGYCVFIHKNFIFNYLNSYFEVLNNKSFHMNLLDNLYIPSANLYFANQENFQKICFKLINIPEPIAIKNLNVFYNATTINDYTTFSFPIVHPIYNVLCKYEEQCSEAYESLKLWNNGYRWKYNKTENNIYLGK